MDAGGAMALCFVWRSAVVAQWYSLCLVIMGRGLEYQRVLGFFILLSFPFLHQMSVLNRVPQRGASLLDICHVIASLAVKG